MASIRNFMDISTGHISKPTRDWLDEFCNRVWDRGVEPSGDEARLCGGATPYGWFLYVPEAGAEPEECPDDLAACFRAARRRRVPYILFDRDAPEVRGLPQYGSYCARCGADGDA